MRILFILFLPFMLQVIAYVAVFAAARGGGSFMGLFSMPVAAVTVIALLSREALRRRAGSAPLNFNVSH